MELWHGIVIGVTIAALAAFGKWVANYFGQTRDKNKVYNWLKENTKDESGHRFRSTKAIASHNNLPLERVQYICHIHQKIHLSTGEKDGMWSIYKRQKTEKRIRAWGSGS